MTIKQTNIRIIAGFPGVGKSKYVKGLMQSSHVLDLDSSNYRDNDINDKMTNYLNTIRTLLTNSNHLLLVSTHKEVLNWLEENSIEYVLVYPDFDKVNSEEYSESRFNRPVDDTVFKARMVSNWQNYKEDLYSAKPTYRITLDKDEYLSDFVESNTKHKSSFVLHLPDTVNGVKTFDAIKSMFDGYTHNTMFNIGCYQEYEEWSATFLFEELDRLTKDLRIKFGVVTKEELEQLTPEEITSLGFGLWDEQSGLYLIPISHLPLLDEDMPVVSIGCEKGVLKLVDKDVRYGLLAWGIVLNKQ